MEHRFLALVALLALGGGCLGASMDEALPASVTARSAPVVIALLDSGTTPYYPVFWVDDDSFVETSIPFPIERVDIPRDPGDDPRERDAALWNALQPRELYHFAGTRLLGISFREPSEYPYVQDSNVHGVATSFVAARDAPEAIIVVVQVDGGFCFTANCVTTPDNADAMEWIAAQPWIDIVSISMALPGNLPDPGQVHPDVSRYLEATRMAAQSGKLVVNGAGNTVAPTLQHYHNGPPWVISVGGLEIARRGEQILAGKGVDVVANFTDYTPAVSGEGDMAWRSGTSLSTPIVAGTLANALHKVRQAQPGRVVTPQELRDALNASATTFGPTDWDPTAQTHSPIGQGGEIEAATLPIVAQAQMGWGYVDASLADEIARRVLEEDFSIPAGKEQAMLFQPRWQQARETFWDAYG